MAHASLQHKLNARSTSNEKEEGGIKELQDEGKTDPEKPADSADDVKPVSYSVKKKQPPITVVPVSSPPFSSCLFRTQISRAMSAFDFSDDSEKENKLFGNTDIKKEKDNLNRRR